IYGDGVCRNGFLLRGRKEGFEPPDPTLMGSQVYPGWRFANSCATVSLPKIAIALLTMPAPTKDLTIFANEMRLPLLGPTRNPRKKSSQKGGGIAISLTRRESNHPTDLRSELISDLFVGIPDGNQP
ncbi:MAG: hypothetical protein WBW14_16655, partial [Candidatus Acidiferrum sp.]